MKTNKKMILIIIISLIFLLLCYLFSRMVRNTLPNNPKERNKIVFKESIAEVRDSLITLESLLKKMPVYQDDWVAYNITDSNILYVNFNKIDSIDNLLKKDKDNMLKALEPLSIEEQQRFLHLAVFLDSNYIYNCEFFKKTGYLECLYRRFDHKGDYYTDLLRFITLIDPTTSSSKDNKYKILDKQGEIFLSAYQEVKIWEGEKK